MSTDRPNGRGIVHVAYLQGHRADYLQLFSTIFGLAPSVGMVGRGNLPDLLRARALLFGTIDDDYRGFFLVALLRALTGRRTAGVLLRPQTCFQSRGLRYRAKRMAFAALKRIPAVSVFTIMPFAVAPDYASVADDGLVDPQMWDLDQDTPPELADAELEAQIVRQAAGRRVIAFVGTAHDTKGIGLLCDAVAGRDWPRDKMLVVIGGRFPQAQAHLEPKLRRSGVLLLPRFLSQAELMAIYARADLVWACYRPDYDQASGIFGRAVQLSRVPVVRSGSMIARFARHFSLAAVELPDRIPDGAAPLLAASRPVQHADLPALRTAWRGEFISRVDRAL